MLLVEVIKKLALDNIIINAVPLDIKLFHDHVNQY
jgi:hypothetical protein